jgi:anti-anti-sigma factor
MTNLTGFQSKHLKLKQTGPCVQIALCTPSIYEEEVIEQIGRDLNTLSDDFDCHRMVLDIKAVNLITSSLIGKFVHLHKKLKSQGGVLVMCGVQGHLETIFRASNLLNYFHVIPTVEKGTEFASCYSSNSET